MGCGVLESPCVVCKDKSAGAFGVSLDDNKLVYNQFVQFRNDKIGPGPVPLTICDKCAINFRDYLQTSLQALRRHVMQYDPAESCECEDCQPSGLAILADAAEKRRESPELLDLSMKRASSGDDTEPSEPSEPSTSSQNPSLVKRKTMNCEHCGKVFTHKGDLKKHLRSHTGEQPFECPMCHRKFAHTSNLARHLRVHSGDRPFRCDRCNRDFGRKDKLLMHQKTKLCQKSNT